VNKNVKLNLVPDDVMIMGDITLAVQRFNTGHAENQGTRAAMLDISKNIQEFLLNYPKKLPFTYIAVYDGHGSKSYVETVSMKLH
jgi:hypothetical protein